MKRVGENPPARYPERPPDQAEYPWCVVKVKPRQEKALAVDCLQRDIEYYLPLYTKVTRRNDNNKPRKSVLPLFAGYLSLAPSPPHSLELRKTGRIVSIIPVVHQKRFIGEMTQIYRSLAQGISLEPEPSLAPGTRVEVFRGPLRGIQGTIVQTRNEARLVLSVTALGQAAMVVDPRTVRPLSK